MYYSHCDTQLSRLLQGKGLRNSKTNKLLSRSYFLITVISGGSCSPIDCFVKYYFVELQITMGFKKGSEVLEMTNYLEIATAI